MQHWLRVRGGPPVFLPMLEDRSKWRSRRTPVVEPLFPSYLFVQMSLEPMSLEPSSWHAVRWTPGVRRIVGTGEVPTPVPLEAIQLLKYRCGTDEVLQWLPAMRTGMQVRVVHGPFAGLEGIIERPSARRERVRVLLQLLGTTSPVEMDIADIECAS